MSEIVFLSANALTGTVPAFVGDSLRGLYLSENKLQGPIPESLCQHTHMEALFLDENELTGSIPTCIGNLSNLKQLYLFKNQLTGFVPIELGRLRNLSKSHHHRHSTSGCHQKLETHTLCRYCRRCQVESGSRKTTSRGPFRAPFVPRRPKIFGPIVAAPLRN
jgi:hypothetical protein